MINLQPSAIYSEYTKGINFKSSLGTKGLYEQGKINERFYIGDQWHNADFGNSRPLIRHNVIKRIADYKLSQILSSNTSIEYGVDGIANPKTDFKKGLKRRISGFKFSGNPGNDEINTISEALNNFFEVTAKRIGLQSICAKALKNAYISGTGIIYTYWDENINTGILKNSTPVKGDIKCEVLNVNNIYFANPFNQSVEEQPYIIISTTRETEDVINEAAKFGADEYTLNNIKGDRNGKIKVLTKLYKI